MADDHHQQFNSGTHWWDRSHFDTAAGGSSSSSTTSSGLTSLGGFPWAHEMGDVKGRSSMDSVSISGGSTVELHMMGLGLSSQAMDWNQSLLRGDQHQKSENSFRSMLHENLNSRTRYQPEPGMGSSHQILWRDHHQMSRGFSLDQPQFSPHGSSSDSTVTCQGLQTSFQIDSPAAMYGGPTAVFQGLLGAENQHSTYENRTTPIAYPYGGSYVGLGTSDEPQQLLPGSWSNSKVPQLHFSNNAPFWNASTSSTTTISDIRPSLFSSLQSQFPTSSFEEKPKKNIPEARDSSDIPKKSGSETSTKRPRNETTSPMPPFKARKEKMGDRITALQQLVSPFGKTDTASVLSEAIEYIKFLHDQVTVLSTPYMKSGAPIHHQQISDKSKDTEGPKKDLRSRGLCLVPVSSTYPVTHETTVDFWTPTFGGTFR